MKVKTPEISWHISEIRPDPEPILSVCFHPSESRFASSGGDHSAKIWEYDYNSQNVEFIANLKNNLNQPVNAVKWSKNGLYIATGLDGGTILIWSKSDSPLPPNSDNKENWTTCKILRFHQQDVYDLAWSLDSKLLISGSVDNTIILWDVESGKSIQQFKDHDRYVQGVCWDPLGKFFVSQSSDRTFRVFAEGKRKAFKCTSTVRYFDGKMKLFRDENLTTRLAVSPDGCIVVTTAGQFKKEDKMENTAFLFIRNEWEKPYCRLPGHESHIVAVAFSPLLYELKKDIENPLPLKYRMIFAVATADYVMIYDTQSPTPIARISDIHYGPLTDLSFRGDGLVLVVSSMDGYCTIIQFEKDELGTPLKKEDYPEHMKQREEEILRIEQETKKKQQESKQTVNILTVRQKS